jgi:hypothetical protein
MRSANSQLPEFASLFQEFESLPKSPDESSQFANLLARFEQLSEADSLARENDISLEETGDLLGRFERLWQPYLEENAAAPPSICVWEVADVGLDEVRNCRVLNWLLVPNESHLQGVRFCAACSTRWTSSG